ncbi:MAG: hypothetical protein JXA33_14195 [Anaerolineae bacterium]|nr:hypothetical protein [Anaerolineae bacterium]
MQSKDNIEIITQFAEGIAKTPQKKHLLFIGCTFVAVLLAGYHFGTFDQAIHIPFLQKFADPSLFPDDPFFEMRFQHYSFFWFLWQPFYKLGILEITLFIAHLGATYLTFWALWDLTTVLFEDALVSVLTTLTFVFPHIGFGVFPILEFSLLNRTFVLPFLLWAIILYLRKHYLWAYFLLGILYNLHVISVNFALGMVALDSLLQIRKVGWRTLILSGLVFLAGAAPVLVWKASGPPVALTPNPIWFSLIKAQFYHLFYPFAPYAYILIPTLSGISALLMFAVSRRHNPAPAHDRTLTNFIYGILLVLIVEVITTEFYPITILVQLQIIRVGLFALIFGYIYFVQYLIARYRAGKLSTFHFYLLFCATATLIFPLLLLLFWGFTHIIQPNSRRLQIGNIGLLALVGIASVAISITYGAWGPGVHIFGPQNAWQDTQLWARDHTPKDALFITPPHHWDLYDSEWRVFSERSTLVTLSDLLEVALVPDYAVEWQEKFAQVAPGAIAHFGGNYFINRQLTAEAYYSLSTADIRRIAEKYQASYVVIEKPHALDLPVVYENEEFIIYSYDAGQ